LTGESVNEHSLDVVYDGVKYGVTGMVGESIAYLRDFFQKSGVAIPCDAGATIFSMGPNEDDPSAILQRGVGILPQGKMGDVFTILQGETLEVTDFYVLTVNDKVVQFNEREGA